MNKMLQPIVRQIGSCKSLLELFQRERRLYTDNDDIGQDDVMRMLDAKLRVLKVFEEQKALLREAAEKPLDGAAADEQREMLRELAGLLEQLLVIDQENELLLRRIMPGGGAAARPVRHPRPVRAKPSVSPAPLRRPRAVAAYHTASVPPARAVAAQYRQKVMNTVGTPQAGVPRYV